MYKKRRKVTKIKILVILILLLIIAKIINFTLSKYESNATSAAELGIAYYILDEDFQTMSINLNSLVPRNEPYVYSFTVENNDGTNRTETAIEYDLTLRTTTNLPLIMELYKNENYDDAGAQNIIDTLARPKVTLADSAGTYFTTYTTDTSTFGFTNNEQNTYYLVVYFPATNTAIQYQDVIENIEIMIESRQII